MNVGPRIKEIRTRLGLTLQDFAKKIGISISTLSDLENGKTNPSTDTLISLAKNVNVNLEWVLLGKGNVFRTFENKTNVKKVPWLKGNVKTDKRGNIILDRAKESFLSNGLVPLLKDDQAYFLWEYGGDNLEPFIYPGDVVLINTSLEMRQDIISGQIYLCKMQDGWITLKVLVQEAQDQICCLNFNPNYQPVSFKLKTEINKYVLGKVQWIGRTIA